MIGDVTLYILALLAIALLLFVTVLVVIMLSDYESHCLNSMELCPRLRPFVIPEFSLHWGLTLIFLLSGQWFSFLINVPLAAYNLNLVRKNKHQYDETTIYREAAQRSRDSLIKLAFFLFCFFYYLYRLVLGLIESSGSK